MLESQKTALQSAASQFFAVTSNENWIFLLGCGGGANGVIPGQKLLRVKEPILSQKEELWSDLGHKDTCSKA